MARIQTEDCEDEPQTQGKQLQIRPVRSPLASKSCGVGETPSMMGNVAEPRNNMDSFAGLKQECGY